MENHIEDGGKMRHKHSLAPRMAFKALKEIGGEQAGLYDKYGGRENFRQTYIPEIGLPRHEDVYGEMTGAWNILRNLIMIKSQEEMEIGVGEEYLLDQRHGDVQEPIPLGVCYGKHTPGNDELHIF